MNTHGTWNFDALDQDLPKAKKQDVSKSKKLDIFKGKKLDLPKGEKSGISKGKKPDTSKGKEPAYCEPGPSKPFVPREEPSASSSHSKSSSRRSSIINPESDDPSEPEESKLYFAYGANLSLERMHNTCPHSSLVGVARLPDHDWFLTRHGFANVAAVRSESVWGLVYQLSVSDEEELNYYHKAKRPGAKYKQTRCEVEVWGVHPGQQVNVSDQRAIQPFDAMLYIDHTSPYPAHEFEIRHKYERLIKQGVRDALVVGMPETYVNEFIAHYIRIKRHRLHEASTWARETLPCGLPDVEMDKAEGKRPAYRVEREQFEAQTSEAPKSAHANRSPDKSPPAASSGEDPDNLHFKIDYEALKRERRAERRRRKSGGHVRRRHVSPAEASDGEQRTARPIPIDEVAKKRKHKSRGGRRKSGGHTQRRHKSPAEASDDDKRAAPQPPTYQEPDKRDEKDHRSREKSRRHKKREPSPPGYFQEKAQSLKDKM